MKIYKSLVAIILMIATTYTCALELPAKPIGFVNDFSGQMSEVGRSTLDQSLGKFQEEKKVSIVIVTAQSAENYGYSGLTDMGVAIFDKWKIGNATRDSGLLILITGSSPPYKVRIVTGRGTEGAVTDLQSKDIVDHVIKPPINAGRFSEGVTMGAEALMKLTSKEFEVGEKKESESFSFALILVVSVLLSLFGVALVVYLVNRSYQKKKEAEEYEMRVQQARLDAIPPWPVPRPHTMPVDTWSKDESYRSARRSPPVASPYKGGPSPRSRSDDTTYVVVPASTPSPIYERVDSPGPTTSSEPSSSVDSGGSTAGGGGGDD